MANERANTILNQLTQSKNGANRINCMLGLKERFIVTDNLEKVSVAFRFKAKATKRINSLYIELNGLDLYNVTFQRAYSKFDNAIGVRIPQLDEIETVKNVYAEDLKDLFEDRTNLCLSI